MAKTPKKSAPPAGSVTIVSRTAGFRRAGVAHASEPVIWPEGSFSEDEMDALMSEPMLTVTETSAPPAA